MTVPHHVPLPMLAEILGKATFPGRGRMEFSGLVASAVDKMEADIKSRTRATDNRMWLTPQ